MRIFAKVFCFAVVLFSPLLSSASMTEPKVGKYALLTASGLNVGSPVNEAFIRIALDGFDSAQDRYLYTIKIHRVDGDFVLEEWRTREDLIQEEVENQAALNECEQEGGVKEVLNLPLGSFNSCKKTDDNGVAWYGNVPFGVLKITESMKFGRGEFVLTEFSW